MPGDTPSTHPPASLDPEEFELEVLAGSPDVEGFWEETASGEEPTLPGIPGNRSAEEGEFKACDLLHCGQGLGKRGWGAQSWKEGLYTGAQEGF